MRLATPLSEERWQIPEHLRPALRPVAARVFWWGTPEEWLDDAIRFAAQVMTFGNWNDTALVSKLLGEGIFQQVLNAAPAGVFDTKSWNYWHLRYHKEVP